MLTLALLLLAADPAVGVSQTYGDWAVACDNLKICEMTSLIGDDGDWPADGPLAASISRAPGPQGGFEIVVDSARATGSLTLAIDGKPVAQAVPREGAVRFRGADAARIVAVLIDGTNLTLANGKAVIAKVSLKGSSAALRFIDTGQGRAGTVTAAAAKGTKPATAVPAAPTVPRVPALRASGAPATVSAALRQQMEKRSGCDESATESDAADKVQTFALGGGATLALLPCGSGAYNINSAPFVLRGGKAAVADIDYSGDGSGEAPMLTNAWWDAKTSMLSTHAKGRGIGDCGESANYVWDGKGFVLIELRSMGECRGSINWLRTWKAEPVYR
ncbi:DUF1176 domain-containing protein [Sphingomonas psychrotolerans]|uniref:DUF1176 domain-containing protein n=1 Tax=Sphingomonas psychrotolerans TaxID=1327635 RepID=A0A2K8ML04_9SPHN|nr:DUF1176 domain-containing protein [Sphingomonas psychrotolerans]ATY33246.1 DUF1176 domain-containing protein [Sphingomonas psychrotolerans]